MESNVMQESNLTQESYVMQESNLTQKSSITSISRRVFLNIFSNGIIAGLMAYLLYPVVRFLIPPKESSRYQDVVQLDAAEVSVGKAKVINYKENPTIVINSRDGLLAFSAVCTHLGCIVQWDESRQEITCPCHGAKYDLDGTVKFGPAPKPLTVVKARLVDDKILVGEA